MSSLDSLLPPLDAALDRSNVNYSFLNVLSFEVRIGIVGNLSWRAVCAIQRLH